MSKPQAPAPVLNRKQRRAAEKTPSFEQAVEAHQAGDLAAAEGLYRKLLAFEPAQVSAMYNLGLIAFQSGRMDEAARLFRQAARIRPDYAEAHANLGGAYRELGRLDEAVESLGRALALQPRDWLSHTNLGLVLRALQRLDEARAHLTAALELEPGALQPRFQLACVLRQQGALEAAAQQFNEVLQRSPDLPDVWSDLGLTYADLGRLDEAVACYSRALEHQAAHAPSLYNLACLLQGQGRFAEAAARYEEALQAQPSHVAARINLALALLQLGRLQEAAACYEAALQLSPENADALCGLADALDRLGRRDEAIETFARAARARPESATILTGLGMALQERGRFGEAIAHLSEAVRLAPGPIWQWSQLALAKKHAADWTGLEECERTMLGKLDQDLDLSQDKAASPFAVVVMNSSPQQQLTAARKWAAKVAGATTPFAPRPPHGRDRIRIGYLSADFRNHATAYLATGLFEAHDRSRFEVIAYSINPSDQSEERRRLEAAFDRFVDLNAVSHGDAARAIFDDEVDILVDLKGYTGGARTEIVAHRPAPIQVNYLGFPGPMGADFVDYVLVDPFIVPPAMAPFYAEKLVQLPVSYQPNMRRPIAADATTRADHGLPEAGFVFCSFNNSYKITPPVFDVWMRLLQAVPGSVLWLLACNELAVENLKREAAARGVDPARLVFAPILASAGHLARQRHADLFLDTLPVCAHTTASDALWAGLPLVSCVGESFVSRVSGSLLTAIGLPELITGSLAEYEALALRLARDAQALADLRRRLWEARTTSSLYDTAAITRRIEAAYEEMWRRHRRGEPPEAFEVPPG